MMMTLEEIKQRGFKDRAGYSLQYIYGWSYLYEFRLKNNGSSVYMEEKITDKSNDGWGSSVKSPFSKVKEWSGVVPVGLNNVPYKATMVVKMSDGSIYSFTHKMNFVRLEEGEIDIDSLVDTAEPQNTEDSNKNDADAEVEESRSIDEERRAREEMEEAERRAREEMEEAERCAREEMEEAERRAREETEEAERCAREEMEEAERRAREETDEQETSTKQSGNWLANNVVTVISVAAIIAYTWFFFSGLSSCGSSVSNWLKSSTEIKVSQGDQYKITNDHLSYEGSVSVVEVSDNHITIECDGQQFTLGNKESGYGSFLVLYDGSFLVVDVYDVKTYASNVLMIYSGNANLKSGHLAKNNVVSSNSHITKFLKEENNE